MCLCFVVHNRCLFNDSQLVKIKKVYSLPREGGHSLKICVGYVRPHWPPFSNRLSLNDPFSFFTFCSHIMTPFSKCYHLMTPFFRNIYRWKWASCSHWMTPIFTNKRPPRDMYPIFVWPPKWPPFFLQTEVFTKRPLLFFFFIVLTKWPPIFLLSSLKDHFFLYLVCHRKTPTLEVVSAHTRHFHMWVPPPLFLTCPWLKIFIFRTPHSSIFS